jgi:hypothetical protein
VFENVGGGRTPAPRPNDATIWQDIRRIRVGRPWDEQVPEGLRHAKVTLAPLTLNLVRRAMDEANATGNDSVSLDEIA